jgi:hypothetical protein
MDQSVDEKIRRRLIYAVKIAWANMTPEAKQLALETETISDLLLELAKWVPVGMKFPEEELL